MSSRNKIKLAHKKKIDIKKNIKIVNDYDRMCLFKYLKQLSFTHLIYFFHDPELFDNYTKWECSYDILWKLQQLHTYCNQEHVLRNIMNKCAGIKFIKR